MKKIKYLIVSGFVFAMSVAVFLSANVTFSSQKAFIELSQVESLARGEGDEGGTCCKDNDEKCTVGSTTVVGYYLLGEDGPCPK